MTQAAYLSRFSSLIVAILMAVPICDWTRLALPSIIIPRFLVGNDIGENEGEQAGADFQVESSFSLLTVVCRAKKMFHHTAAYIEARLAYTAAMFNVVLGLDRQEHPDHALKLSNAEFSL